MADIQQLEEQIVGLSLLDAAQLVKKLEERLGVSAAAAAPVMMAGGGAAAGAAPAGSRGVRPPTAREATMQAGPSASNGARGESCPRGRDCIFRAKLAD